MEPEGSLPHSQVPAYFNIRLSCIVKLADFFFSGRFVVNILAVYCTAVFIFQFNYDIYGSLGLTRNPNYVAAVCTYRCCRQAYRPLQVEMFVYGTEQREKKK